MNRKRRTATIVLYSSMLLVCVALLSTFFEGCSRNDKVPVPEPLLSETQMMDVLTDTYLLEAELQHRKSLGENVGDLQGTYYDQLFEHHGITDSIFHSNMTYYSYQHAAMERIMDSVYERLASMQAESH